MLYLFHHFPSLWEFFSAKSKSQGLVTDSCSRGLDLVLSLPDLSLWLGTEIPLHTTVGQGPLKIKSTADRGFSNITQLINDRTMSICLGKTVTSKVGTKDVLGGFEAMHLKGLIQCFRQVEEGSRSRCLMINNKLSSESSVEYNALSISL